MNDIENSLETISGSFADVCAKIAEVTNLSIDYVQKNLVDAIMIFGKYELVSTIVDIIFGVGIFWIIVSIIAFFVCASETGGYFSRIFKVYLKMSICIMFLTIFLGIGRVMAMYLVSPEVYSVKAVLELLQG